jgi:hypothetical protein
MFELQQLVSRIDRQEPVTVEEYLQAFFYENANKDIGFCVVCGAHGGARGDQHAVWCRHASIMVLPDWLTVFRQREQEPRVGMSE